MQTTNEQTRTETPNSHHPANGQVGPDAEHARAMLRIVAKRSFCTMASTSERSRSHSAGVVYQEVDGELWIHTTAESRKARNVATTGQVGIGLAFRRLPVGPPFTIHYQAKAQLIPMDAPEAVRLIEAGRIDRVAGHGALEMADGCFIKVARPSTIHSYGPGARIIDLIRDPLNNGARSVAVPRPTGRGR